MRVSSSLTLPTYHTKLLKIVKEVKKVSKKFGSFKKSMYLCNRNNKDMEKRKMSEDELRWQSEEDARTLERYQEIVNDKARLDRAMKVAAKTVDNLEERAKALSKSLTGLKKKK